MTIAKHEFYEGAALHQLVTNSKVESIRYEAQVFTINNSVQIYLKYCTKNRTPWGFTFTSSECTLLETCATNKRVFLGLVCAADGIAAISHEMFRSIASQGKDPFSILCHRKFGKHYLVSGPNGSLSRKIAPSQWQRILEL